MDPEIIAVIVAALFSGGGLESFRRGRKLTNGFAALMEERFNTVDSTLGEVKTEVSELCRDMTQTRERVARLEGRDA